MKAARHVLPSIILLLVTALLNAQEPDIPNQFLLQDNLEQLSQEEEDANWEDELEELDYLIGNPLDLNTATRSQLEQFPFLSAAQVENILAYLYLHGSLQSIYELNLMKEMDRRTIDLLLPFVCVKPVKEEKKYPSFRRMLENGTHEALTRFDIPFYTRKGYEDKYLGPPLYNSLRYSFRYGNYLQAGVSGEKDAGEPFFALYNRKGYDSYSYYLLINTPGKLKTLALGNYRLSFGMGLVLNSGFRLGKTFSVSTSDFRSTGIRKHSSTDEYNYFRGAAATVEVLPGLEVSPFYSHRTLDGVVKDGQITSIYKSGLHRSESEAEKRRLFSLQLAGGNVSYRHRSLKVELTGIYYFFNHPYEPALREYAKYNLHGNRFYNIGLGYSYRLGRFAWTGEAATGKQGYAFLNRLSYSVASDYNLLLIHRYYAYNYWAMFARSFGEGSLPQNENGWYAAFEAAPLKNWRFFAAADFFSFPWWKYRISKPSQGTDLQFQVTYAPTGQLSMYANYRYKRKERDVAGTGGEVTLPTHQHKARYRLTFSPGSWQFQTTADYNHFHSQGQAPDAGFLVTQSAAFSLLSFPLALSLQGSYFHTDNYDSRIYAYEKGLLYTFYIPSFYGQGFRYFARVAYTMQKRLMIMLKFGHTIYCDRNEIGSGDDLIKSNRKADLQVQIRLKF